MNQKSAKKLRKLLTPQDGDEISKRAYRLAKKRFKKLPAEEKAKFIKHLEYMINSTK
jgi:hypothetical protein